MIFAREVWVFSPSSGQTEGLWENRKVVFIYAD